MSTLVVIVLSLGIVANAVGIWFLSRAVNSLTQTVHYIQVQLDVSARHDR